MGFLEDTMKSSTGCLLVSCLLGLGMATMFQRVCKDSLCYIMEGPDRAEVHKSIWKSGSACYRYTSYPSKCTE